MLEKTPTEEDPKSLYHIESTDPYSVCRSENLPNGDPSSLYNRDILEYESEVKGLNCKELVGKDVLDIGAGAYDMFGRQARERGINVISINPALSDPQHKAWLQEALDHDREKKQEEASFEFARRPYWKKLFTKMVEIPPEVPMVLEANAQNMPFSDNSFDLVLSVYGVPHYLHHVDFRLSDDEEIINSYTPEVREADKEEIRKAFTEIVRVLKPGGKAMLRDSHRAKNQFTKVDSFSPSDGTEVVEVLQELKSQGLGIDYQIEILDDIRHRSSYTDSDTVFRQINILKLS